MTVALMARWIWTGVVHASLTFWLPYLAYAQHDTIADPADGRADGMAVVGFTAFLSLVWAMQLVAALQALTWTRVGLGVIGFSMCVFYFFAIVYASSWSFSADFYGVALAAFARPATWLSVLLSWGTVGAWELACEAARLEFAPRAIDIKRELAAGLGAKNGATTSAGAGSAQPTPLASPQHPAAAPRRAATDESSASAPPAGAAPQADEYVGNGRPPLNVWA